MRQQRAKAPFWFNFLTGLALLMALAALLPRAISGYLEMRDWLAAQQQIKIEVVGPEAQPATPTLRPAAGSSLSTGSQPLITYSEPGAQETAVSQPPAHQQPGKPETAVSQPAPGPMAAKSQPEEQPSPTSIPNLETQEDEFIQACLRARIEGRRSSPGCYEAIQALGTGR